MTNQEKEFVKLMQELKTYKSNIGCLIAKLKEYLIAEQFETKASARCCFVTSELRTLLHSVYDCIGIFATLGIKILPSNIEKAYRKKFEGEELSAEENKLIEDYTSQAEQYIESLNINETIN